VFTFVVSLVVVGGAILAVVAIAQSGEEQPATPWPLRRRASRPSRRVRRPPHRSRRARPVPALQAAVTMPLSATSVAAPARPVSPAGEVIWSPSPAPVALAEPVERVRRLRSTAALVLLLALVGVVLAVLVGTGLFVLNAVLRHAASSGALAAFASFVA
jgi:hypothetical protein